MTDNVNNPSHYKRFRFECEPKDFTKHLPHPLASALEYIIRAPFKLNELEDLEKSIFWLKEFINTPDLWDSDVSDAYDYEIYCKILVGEGEGKYRYLAAAWGISVTCAHIEIPVLFSDKKDPMTITLAGTKALLDSVQDRVNELNPILLCEEVKSNSIEVMDVD